MMLSSSIQWWCFLSQWSYFSIQYIMCRQRRPGRVGPVFKQIQKRYNLYHDSIHDVVIQFNDYISKFNDHVPQFNGYISQFKISCAGNADLCVWDPSSNKSKMTQLYHDSIQDLIILNVIIIFLNSMIIFLNSIYYVQATRTCACGTRLQTNSKMIPLCHDWIHNVTYLNSMINFLNSMIIFLNSIYYVQATRTCACGTRLQTNPKITHLYHDSIHDVIILNSMIILLNPMITFLLIRCIMYRQRGPRPVGLVLKQI